MDAEEDWRSPGTARSGVSQRLEAIQTDTADGRDAADDTLREPGRGELFEEFGGSPEPVLPKELADRQARIEKLRGLEEQLQAADAARVKEGEDPEKNPAKIPVHDDESRIMPDKDGDYAPKYTPSATTESHGGFIVDTDVVNEISDADTLLPNMAPDQGRLWRVSRAGPGGRRL